MVIALVPPPRREQPSAVALSFGARLKALRERTGKTQQEVADALNLSNKTVSAYENGRAMLGADDFPAWAQALGVSVAELTHSLGLSTPADTNDSDLRRAIVDQLGPDRAEHALKILDKMRNRPIGDLEKVVEITRVILD